MLSFCQFGSDLVFLHPNLQARLLLSQDPDLSPTVALCGLPGHWVCNVSLTAAWNSTSACHLIICCRRLPLASFIPAVDIHPHSTVYNGVISKRGLLRWAPEPAVWWRRIRFRSQLLPSSIMHFRIIPHLTKTSTLPYSSFPKDCFS